MTNRQGRPTKIDASDYIQYLREAAREQREWLQRRIARLVDGALQGKRWKWVETQSALRLARHQDAADYMAAQTEKEAT